MASPSLKKRAVYIYIDNSNLWLQGQKTYAKKKGLDVDSDPTWRYDVNRLTDTLLSNLRDFEADSAEIFVNLYGSGVEGVMRAFEKNDAKVHAFNRSTFTGREKEVDNAIIADAVEQAGDSYYAGQAAEFIIVSGDRDLYCAVQKIIRRDFHVHVWSWSSSLANIYKTTEDCLSVHILDRHLEAVGYNEINHRVSRGTISPDSLVVLEAYLKPKIMRSFLEEYNIPYILHTGERDEAVVKDIIVIPSLESDHEESTLLYEASKRKLEQHGLTVVTYFEYSDSGRNIKTQPMSENYFEQLSRSPSASSKESSEADSSEWRKVNKNQKQQRNYQIKSEQKWRTRCNLRGYCKNALNCKYGHVQEEKDYFLIHNAPKKAVKYELCTNQDCWRGKNCTFAHGEKELFCRTCGKTGAGHKMPDCPESSRNMRRFS